MDIQVKDLGAPGVSPIKVSGTGQQTCGFGYVFVPKGVDRDSFVNSCFRKNRIAIIDDSAGNIIYDCYISSEALSNLVFPEKDGEKGMGVIWISQPFLDNPMVIGTFNNFDKITLQSDQEINIRKAWGSGFLEIKGNAKDGRLYINANGKDFGEIHLSALGNNAAAIYLASNGVVNINADETVNVVSNGGVSVNVANPENNNTTGLIMDSGSLVIHADYGIEEDKGTTVTITEDEITADVILNQTKGKLVINDEEVTADLTINETSYSSTTTESGTQTLVKVGEGNYQQIIDAEKYETVFQDCTIRAEDGKLTVSQGDAVIELSAGKMAIVNGGTGLNELFTKIVEAISSLTVSTPQGPSGTPLPPTIAKTQQINSLLKQFFNR